MSEKKIEMKTEASREKKTAGSRPMPVDARKVQGKGINRSSSTMSPAELEYAFARPV